MTTKSQPTTPVRVPKTATTYSRATQDDALRSQINTCLLRDGHVERIQSHLSQALAAHPSNWPSRVSAHALRLLRSGDYNTFPQLMERVLADVRRDTDDARRIEEVSGPVIVGGELTNTTTPMRTMSGTMSGTSASGSGNGSGSSGPVMGSANGSTSGSASGVGSGSLSLSLSASISGNGSGSGNTERTKGKGLVNGETGKGAKGKEKEGDSMGVVPVVYGLATTNLAVPKTVIDEAVKVTRECLDLICEIEE